MLKFAVSFHFCRCRAAFPGRGPAFQRVQPAESRRRAGLPPVHEKQTIMLNVRRYHWFLAALLLLTGCHKSSGPPFSPAETVRGLQVESGLTVEVYASEPQIA